MITLLGFKLLAANVQSQGNEMDKCDSNRLACTRCEISYSHYKLFSGLLPQEVVLSQTTRLSNGRLQFELDQKNETGHLSQEVGPHPDYDTYY